MLAEETRRRQDALNLQLMEMSAQLFDAAKVEEIAMSLNALYSDGFRHNYAEFFPLILDIAKNDSTKSVDYLTNNLTQLSQHVEETHLSGNNMFDGLHQRLKKLCDHINLEVGRLSYYTQNESLIRDVAAKSHELKSEVERAKSDLKHATDKASSLQTEMIAVLSIFSAVIIAFFGGLSFLGNALAGMNTVHIYKATFTITLCGLVLSNVIFLLLYWVGKIMDRNFYAKCKTPKCSCNADGTPKCTAINRFRKRMPYAFYTNALLVIILIVDCGIWYIVGAAI